MLIENISYIYTNFISIRSAVTDLRRDTQTLYYTEVRFQQRFQLFAFDFLPKD